MGNLYRTLMHACGIGAALTIGVMALLVTFDVIARNTGLGSFPWVVEVSEYSLPLATFLAAPWLLYRNEHVRLDMLLTVWPRLAHVTNVLGFAVCVLLVIYGVRTILNSNGMVLKSVVFPEWWLYVPVPLCFGLLAIEFVRRMALACR